MLKSLSLGDFMNDNVTILPQLLYLEELIIGLNSHEKFNSRTQLLINFYLFAAPNNFRKVTLNSSQGVQLKPQIQSNTHLEELSIQIATVDDLPVLFTLVPCLIRLEVSIIHRTSSTFVPQDRFSIDITLKLLKELYLYTMDEQAMSFTTLKVMMSLMPSMEYLAFGIKTNDPDYAEAMLWTDLITSMPRLATLHLGLEITMTEILFSRFDVETYDDLKQVVFDSFVENIDISSFIIYTNIQTLFIDTVPYRFNRDQSYSTSPEAVRALWNNATAIQQSPHRLVGLSMNGEHVPIALRSFRILCQRGTLQLAHTLMKDDQSRLKWLAHINATGSHLAVQPKSLALWKSDIQMTYF
ncbi:unnamed protein product [Rotaria sordida]|uniref:Uncharacterized protein n=1 Tax=Rotaria sordida TaxID=392033 RepID=A0A819PAX3_9BILA|nr:unnamed protein product [Rotaria sordida]CAF4010925.1 unnamed protein product [Rotaria sordida]